MPARFAAISAAAILFLHAAASAAQWQVLEKPVYSAPDGRWSKDPSVIKAGDTWYLFYTAANPWQDTGAGGQGEPRIDYATSPDGLHWTRQGTAIGRGKPGAWDDLRPLQAPAKPILKEGVWHMYYAAAGKKVAIGYATSTDLRHWTKAAANPVIAGMSKCNDPFVYVEDGTYYLFFNDMQERVYYVTSKDLVSWSAKPVSTGAVGEGNIVLKDRGTYTMLTCVGWSHKGEYYKSWTAPSLAKPFADRGPLKIDYPRWAAGAHGHGDVVERDGEYWFYFQGTNDVGKTFQIGLAKHPIGPVAR